jgi:hypothetical protein
VNRQVNSRRHFITCCTYFCYSTDWRFRDIQPITTYRQRNARVHSTKAGFGTCSV